MFKKIKILIFLLSINLICISADECKTVPCFDAKSYKVGVFKDKGSRHEMQDVSSVSINRQYIFCNICDGHGSAGFEVASKVDAILYNYFNDKSELSSKFIVDAFRLADDSINNKYSGSTALTALINGKKFYIVNLGDSKAVLSFTDNENVLQMSTEHNTSNDEEVTRITNVGGKFGMDKNGTLRVLDYKKQTGLIPTRSFGDKNFKGIIAVPEIKEYEIQGNEDFLILASDGLWDVVSNESSISIVKEEFLKKRDPNNAAKVLASIAANRGSTDNITIFVIDLKKK